MKSDLLPTPADLSLSEVMERFAPELLDKERKDEDRKAREYLEAIRWANGPVCPHCQNAEQSKIWKLEANLKKKVRNGLYHCKACDKQFTVMVGTIFTDSHIPLRKWLVAWYLICNAKKGVSALQIQRALGLGSYRTAWMMMHKIRHAMADPVFTEPMKGTLEMDEMYYGPKPKKDKDGKLIDRGFRKNSSKIPILALVNREDGRVRTQVLPIVTWRNLKTFLDTHANRDSAFNTDESNPYKCFGRRFKKHHKVKHRRKEYQRINPDGSVASTNLVESFFSILRRGLNGSFHHVSKEHLFRYCDEFAFRWNYRKSTDGERFVAGLKQTEGKRLTYKTPKETPKPGEPPSS